MLAREQMPTGSGPGVAAGTGVRMTIGIMPAVYVGIETTAGRGLGDASPGSFAMLAGVVGFQRRIDRTTVAAELAAGAFLDGFQRGTPVRTDLDVRLRIERWLSPWVTAGVFVGADPLLRDYTAGGQLAFRFRAFDAGW